GFLPTIALGVVIFPLEHLKDLVLYYGCGKVPTEDIPDFRHLGNMGQVINLLGMVASAAGFLSILFIGKRVAEKENIAMFKYNFRWSCVAIVIPFVKFFQPWLSIAEIYKSWKFAR